MSNFKIRKTENTDFESIRKLYEIVYNEDIYELKSKEILSWLYLNTSQDGNLCSLVALDGDRVVGHIGYIVSEYMINGRKFKGLHPMDWIVHPDVKGGAGLMLLAKILKSGEFSFVIGGSELTKQICQIYKFQKRKDIPIFFKSVNNFRYCLSMKENIFRKYIRFVYYSWKQFSITNLFKSDNLEMKNSDTVDFSIQMRENILYNSLSEKHVDWIMNCPNNESSILEFYYKGSKCGMAILYMRKNSNGIKEGKLIHFVMNEGFEDHIDEAVRKIEYHFRKNGCLCMYALFTTDDLMNVFWKNGYSSYQIPLYLRDVNKIFNDDDEFYLSFFDGDLAYR